jgi:hypothetical protein
MCLPEEQSPNKQQISGLLEPNRMDTEYQLPSTHEHAEVKKKK